MTTARRLQRVLAVDLVVAWRLLSVCKAARETPNPSSAVRKTVVLICRGLCNLDRGFLHYIFDCMLNDSVLLGQVQPQSLQQFSHQPLRSRHGA